METTKIALFKGRKIRKTLYNNEWWFSVINVIEALTDSVNSRDYWYKMKIRVKGEDGIQLSTICRQLKLEASDGKKYETDCANTEGIFRIIQSIPSPKAEPFKRWLAKVGYERVQEIENPELATKRTRMLYKLKGYSDNWIEKRMRGIAIREELTDEWQKRGAQEQKDYEILTAEISKATFGVTPSDYKKLKGLKRENLRDHMDDFELIFTMLGEKSTTEIHRNENSQGVTKLKSDAKIGGDIAGGA
ncbi:MAG: phage antirepressor protein, partial [Flavobacterium sp.]|nr:phage antirepressor protein [Flavobacterium sp.]